MNKKKILRVMLAIEAVICVIFSFLWRGEQNVTFFEVLRSPFELIGKVLRYLSLSGATGNVIAIILYAIVCLLPVAATAYMLKIKKAKWEEILLALLSALLFWSIYMFINPGKIVNMDGIIISVDTYKDEMVLTMISVIVLYWVVKIIRTFDNMKEKQFVRALKIASAIALICIVACIWFIGFSDLLTNIDKAIENNMYVVNTGVVLVLKYMAVQLPNVCMFIIICHLLNVAGLINEGFINKNVLEEVNKISVICRKSIITILFAGMVVNIIQLMVAGNISIADFNVTVPVFDILLIIVLLIITRMIAESYEIKEDNDLFI